jgi:hypothetical protein
MSRDHDGNKLVRSVFMRGSRTLAATLVLVGAAVVCSAGKPSDGGPLDLDRVALLKFSAVPSASEPPGCIHPKTGKIAALRSLYCINPGHGEYFECREDGGWHNTQLKC